MSASIWAIPVSSRITLDGRREPGDLERPARLRLRSPVDQARRPPTAATPDHGDDEHEDQQDRRAGGGRCARDPSPPHRRATGRSRAVCPHRGARRRARASAGEDEPQAALRRGGEDRLAEDEVGQADAEVGHDDPAGRRARRRVADRRAEVAIGSG